MSTAGIRERAFRLSALDTYETQWSRWRTSPLSWAVGQVASLPRFRRGSRPQNTAWS